jgi:hypothetical protein
LINPIENGNIAFFALTGCRNARIRKATFYFGGNLWIVCRVKAP